MIVDLLSGGEEPDLFLSENDEKIVLIRQKDLYQNHKKKVLFLFGKTNIATGKYFFK